MTILVIDGQGGGFGKTVVEHLVKEFPGVKVMAVGTNSLATSAMLKAGATAGATGEHAVIYNCRHADVIIGTLGIGFANSMHGEISPQMAQAVSQSEAMKLLVPMSKCNVQVVGVEEKPMSAYIQDVVDAVRQMLPSA